MPVLQRMSGVQKGGSMKVTALGITVFMFSCASLYAQQKTIRGSGKVIEESREVSGFNRVDMAAIGTLRLKQGNQEGLRIKVEDNLLRYFETRVVDGTLVIDIKKIDRLYPTQPVEFDLWVKELREIRLSGAANIQAPNLEAGQFSVTVTGAGDVEMSDFQAKRLQVWMAGAGNVIMSGWVEEQDITMKGKSGYKARNLISTRAEIFINGVGNAELQVRDALHAEIVGIGAIRYRGNPRKVEKSVTGMGTITPVD
jgi:hypothetical protein